MGQRLLTMPSSTMETKWKTAPSAKAPSATRNKLLAAADQGEDGVQQAERIQRGGHAQPDDAHFSHGRVGSASPNSQYIAAKVAGTGGGVFRGAGRVGLRGNGERKKMFE